MEALAIFLGAPGIMGLVIAFTAKARDSWHR